jgi:hypothetical protein
MREAISRSSPVEPEGVLLTWPVYMVKAGEPILTWHLWLKATPKEHTLALREIQSPPN